MESLGPDWQQSHLTLSTIKGTAAYSILYLSHLICVPVISAYLFILQMFLFSLFMAPQVQALRIISQQPNNQ